MGHRAFCLMELELHGSDVLALLITFNDPARVTSKKIEKQAGWLYVS
jgi:hypothetical protein